MRRNVIPSSGLANNISRLHQIKSLSDTDPQQCVYYQEKYLICILLFIPWKLPFTI